MVIAMFPVFVNLLLSSPALLARPEADCERTWGAANRKRITSADINDGTVESTDATEIGIGRRRTLDRLKNIRQDERKGQEEYPDWFAEKQEEDNEEIVTKVRSAGGYDDFISGMKSVRQIVGAFKFGNRDPVDAGERP